MSRYAKIIENSNVVENNYPPLSPFLLLIVAIKIIIIKINHAEKK
jgi:hypothetical protein